MVRQCGVGVGWGVQWRCRPSDCTVQWERQWYQQQTCAVRNTAVGQNAKVGAACTT